MSATRRFASLLIEGERRMRGDGAAASTTDPREVQREFDREAGRG